MNLEQLAQTTLRLLRKRGLTLRVEHFANDREPVLHVTPNSKLTHWVRQAIPRCKLELITLLEAEPGTHVRIEDATGALVRAIGIPRCIGCGGRDFAPTADGQDAYCVTCATPETVLQGELEQGFLALRWPHQAEKECNVPPNSVESEEIQASPTGADNTHEALATTPVYEVQAP